MAVDIESGKHDGTAAILERFQHDVIMVLERRGRSSVATLTLPELAVPDQGEEITLTRGQETELPNEVAVGFTDAVDEYKSGAVSATRLAGYSERKSDLRLALVMDQVQAQSIADRALPVSVVHGGHFPSFGPTRFRQLIDEYVAGHRKPGCHLG